MNTNLPGLTPAERERLALIVEECGEVLQVIGKITRHGFESYHPHDPEKTTNRTLLERELGDLRAAIRISESNGDISNYRVVTAAELKLLRVGAYVHHHTEGQIPKLMS